jgi:large subunit ribosomal protein L15
MVPRKKAKEMPKEIGLESLRPAPGSRRRKWRVGRGPGSGNGKTAGAGNKGQLSRAGFSRLRGFEGGQMPLHRRIPKRGFRNLFRKEYAVVNLDQLSRFPGEVTPEGLLGSGLIKRLGAGLVILGRGEAPKGLKVKAHRFSGQEREKIEKAGGVAEVLPERRDG